LGRIRHLFSKLILTPISRSVRKKFLLLFLLLAIIPLMIAATISYINTKAAIERITFNQNNSQMDWVQKNILDDLNRINDVLTAFYFDSDVSFYINKVHSEGSFGTLSAFFMNKIKSYYFANYRDFKSTRLYLVDALTQYEFSLDGGLISRNLAPDFLKTDPVFTNPAQLQFNDVTGEQYQLLLKSDGPVMMKYYNRFEDRKLMAALAVQLNWKLFDTAIDLLSSDEDSQTYLIRETGQIVYGHFTQYVTPELMKTMLEQAIQYQGASAASMDQQYIFARQLSDDIFILKTIPIQNIRRAYLLTLNYQLLLIFVTAVLIIILVLIIGYNVTKPVTSLARSMHDIEQYLESDQHNYVVQVKTNDEIKILEQSYVMMIEKIKNLINQEYRQKIEKQSAQLMALQAQINPHFMYNTLQMIGGMAVKHNVQEIYQIVSAFSRMMRYNMQMADTVTISQELMNIDYYLEIQESRFENKLTVKKSFDPGCLDCLIPKLSLQPLLENCFKYGFNTRRKRWIVRIEIAAQDDQIRITIADNGTGLTDDQIQEINLAMKNSENLPVDRLESLGLRNINSRIKLFFGSDYGLSISHAPEGGALVTLLIGRRLHQDSTPELDESR
jgi:two-component system sensor histidine kinase YesM